MILSTYLFVAVSQTSLRYAMGVKMEISLYNTSDEFLIENKAMLLQCEAVSQLLLFNAIKNRGIQTSEDLLFGKVTHNKEPFILFVNVLPYNLLIHVVNSNRMDEAIRFLVDYIALNKIHIQGLNASKGICDSFINYYETVYRDRCFEEHLAMDIMEIRTLSKLQLAKGYTREAKACESRQLAVWMVEFVQDALSEEVLLECQIPIAERLINAGKFFVFETPDGGVVSMASTSRQLVNGVSIGYVYTPREFRGRGYAATNMYYLSKKMLEKGNKFCTLFVDKKNPISNRVYDKIGYSILQNQYDYKLT